METQENNNVVNSTISYFAVRRWLGVLGITLPILVWVFNDFELRPSISHFYYTSSSVIFTGFMCAFGLFLILYPGRPDKVFVTDNKLTNIAGFFAMLTALLPTTYCITEGCNVNPPLILQGGEMLSTQFIHNNELIGTLHLSFAAIFLALMGYMSFSRFTKQVTDKKKVMFYKFCGVMTWLPLVAIAVMMLLKVQKIPHYVYIFECMSLFFFGIAWLRKGKTLEWMGLVKK